METKLSSKDMLRDICSMRSRAIDLLKEEKDYHTLLATVTEKDYYYYYYYYYYDDDDEKLPWPSIKGLAEKTGLKYELVRKQLKQIYEDLLPTYESSKPFQFPKVKCEFYVKGISNSLFLDTDVLYVMPRVGENILIPFFSSTFAFYFKKQTRWNM